MRWVLIGDLVDEKRYWDAFNEIRIAQGQTPEEEAAASAGPHADIGALYELLDFDIAVGEIGRSADVRLWLWRSSQWLTVFTHWTTIVFAQLLMIGVYCGRFSVKRVLTGPGVSRSASGLSF